MRHFLTAILMAAALPGCVSPPGGDLPSANGGSAAEHAGTVTVVVRGPQGAEHAFEAEVAADPSARRLGLMHRTELPPDAGMLFVFPDATSGGFWMKNTLIPLTIAFAEADGTIVAVLDMEPCRRVPCPSYRPGAPYRYALEVNEGALGDAAAGWRLDIEGDLPPAS